MKLTGTDRQTDRRTDGKDHILSQADALTDDNILGLLAGRLQGSLSSIPLQLTLPLLATLISCSKRFALQDPILGSGKR